MALIKPLWWLVVALRIPRTWLQGSAQGDPCFPLQPFLHHSWSHTYCHLDTLPSLGPSLFPNSKYNAASVPSSMLFSRPFPRNNFSHSRSSLGYFSVRPSLNIQFKMLPLFPFKAYYPFLLEYIPLIAIG